MKENGDILHCLLELVSYHKNIPASNSLSSRKYRGITGYLLFSLNLFWLIHKDVGITYTYEVFYMPLHVYLHSQVKCVCLKHFSFLLGETIEYPVSFFRMQCITLVCGHFPVRQNMRLFLLNCNLVPIGQSFPISPSFIPPQSLLTTILLSIPRRYIVWHLGAKRLMLSHCKSWLTSTLWKWLTN